ncbi:Homocitrate synthase, mitochondrial [Metarhizium anisopliae]|nr:Homocitrate synthase, mitochondrial [Metarhizium anisopliae]
MLRLVKSTILSARFAALFHATLKCICTTIRAALLQTVMLHSKPAQRRAVDNFTHISHADIDTSVLGIGERNGITSLGGLMALMMVGSRDHVMSRYKLHKIKEIEDMMADAVQIAGIHAKAILANPSTFVSRLTGWNAIKSRVE